MTLTELLVTGYDGNDAVFAANLVPCCAMMVLTSADDGIESKVDSKYSLRSQAFDEVREIVVELAARHFAEHVASPS